jgi:hypothetical protein
MTFTFTLDASLVMQAFALHWRRIALLTRVLMALVIAVALAASLYAWLAIGFRPLGFIMAAVVALMYLSLSFVRWSTRRNFARQLGFMSKDQLLRCDGEVSSDTLVIRGDVSVSTLKAEHIVRIRENAELMLLYRTPRMFFVIPKGQLPVAVVEQIRISMARR